MYFKYLAAYSYALLIHLLAADLVIRIGKIHPKYLKFAKIVILPISNEQLIPTSGFKNAIFPISVFKDVCDSTTESRRAVASAFETAAGS